MRNCDETILTEESEANKKRVPRTGLLCLRSRGRGCDPFGRPSRQPSVWRCSESRGWFLGPAASAVPALGLGGPIGRGSQYFSWIALVDAVGAIKHALDAESLSGPDEMRPPRAGHEPRVHKRACWHPRRAPFTVPEFMAHLIKGEAADELLLASTRATPKRLLDSGYRFHYPTLSGALGNMLEVRAGSECELCGGNWLRSTLNPFGPECTSESSNATMDEVRVNIWRLRRAYEEATQGQAFEELSEEIRLLGPSAGELSQSVRAWADVIETLMREMEIQYGNRVEGAYKKQQVKSALIYWFRRSNINLPLIPGFVEPFIFSTISDWSIEAIFVLARHNELWAPVTATASPAPSWWLHITTPVRGLITRLLHQCAAFAWLLVMRLHPITPEMEKAIDAVTDETMLTHTSFLGRVTEFLRWAGNHQTELVAMIQLISVAAHEAESFLDKSGPEKESLCP